MIPSYFITWGQQPQPNSNYRLCACVCVDVVGSYLSELTDMISESRMCLVLHKSWSAAALTICYHSSHTFDPKLWVCHSYVTTSQSLAHTAVRKEMEWQSDNVRQTAHFVLFRNKKKERSDRLMCFDSVLKKISTNITRHLIQTEALCASSPFKHIYTLLFRFWPSVSGSSGAHGFASCHRSSKADEATEGGGAELGCVQPARVNAQVTLGQVDAQEEEPEDRGYSIDSPQPENDGKKATCRACFCLNFQLLWDIAEVDKEEWVLTWQILLRRQQWDKSTSRQRLQPTGCLFHTASPAGPFLQRFLGEGPADSARPAHLHCFRSLEWIHYKV